MLLVRNTFRCSTTMKSSALANSLELHSVLYAAAYIADVDFNLKCSSVWHIADVESLQQICRWRNVTAKFEMEMRFRISQVYNELRICSKFEIFLASSYIQRLLIVNQWLPLHFISLLYFISYFGYHLCWILNLTYILTFIHLGGMNPRVRSPQRLLADCHLCNLGITASMHLALHCYNVLTMYWQCIALLQCTDNVQQMYRNALTFSINPALHCSAVHCPEQDLFECSCP